MTLHRLFSQPGRALSLPTPSYLQGALWGMGGTPDEQMQLEQHADWPTTLILVKRGDQRALLELDLTGAPLLVDNTALGLGGIDVGAVAADTVYDLRVVCDARGENAGVIATVSGNAPTLPAGYPWVSPVIGAMVTDNNADNLVLHDVGDGWFQYAAPVTVLSAGTSTIPATATIDCSSVVPLNASKRFQTRVAADNANAAAKTLDYGGSPNQAVNLWWSATVSNVAPNAQYLCVTVNAYVGDGYDSSDAVRYDWSAVPIGGFYLYMLGFQLVGR